MDAQSSQIKDYLIRFPELIMYVVKAGYTEASAKAAVMFCKYSDDGLKNEDVDEDEVMDCVYENSSDDEWVDEWSAKYDEERENVLQNQLKFTGGHAPQQMKPAFTMSADEMTKTFENLNSCQEKIMLLWDTYCGKLSGLVSDKYIGLDLLGETLKQMAERVDPISTELEDSLLEMFTTVRCFSPEDTLTHLSETINNSDKASEFQLMDDSEFRSEGSQRTYQYLKHFQGKSLEMFKFDRRECPDSPQEWLKCILHYCKIRNPSWAELCHFTHFLNVQLKKCEESVFCSDMLRNDLTGFRDFVVKFMITMSTDFTMPSLATSDESGGSTRNEDKNEGADDVLNEFQIRKHWEQEAHPYIMFNSDGVSMTFLGFHIQNYNAVDVRTGKVIEENVISKLLFDQLRVQRVPMNVDFKTLHRTEQLEILCRVLGVQEKDPDSTYQLTLDNALKILAIHMRFQCNIPVVIMGETGCGKTRLVKFMCDLLRKDDDKTNLLMVRVHGGTTSDMIYKKVEQAIEVSKRNRDLGMYTVLFFDEANTTEALYAIKEVMCDRAIKGEQIDAPDLKFVAACNPYRKHTQSAIEQLEKAGLGYRVRAEDTSEKLGQIPMRQLVYRVQPLPASLSPLVWDFGKLNEHTQELYITKMVETFFTTENLEERHKSVFTNVINISQTHMTESNECRMVSLRDIERCMKTVMWFYQQKDKLFPLIDQKKKRPDGTDQRRIDDIIRSLILAVGVCYSASLEDRNNFLELTARALSLNAQEMLEEIELCQEVFVDNMDIPAATAKNDALKENVFMMIVCMNLRLPLFLVGKPGSSKSLSKTVAADALQGKSSRSELFKSYKQAQLLSFQCSAHSTSDGIISTFRQCAQLQKKKNLDEYVSVVVLDEIGLAEDSPKMPLKTLHPLLECGSIDDEEPEDYKKVGFIGMSNWSLDPAKMNRGILLFRASPREGELEKTAREIYSAARPLSKEIEESLPTLTKAYSEILKKQVNEFYGLRDYYNLIKVIVTYAQSSEPSTADLARAVQRNFGILDSVNSLDIFSEEFNVEVKPAKTIDLVRENLQTKKKAGLESRYLLLMSSNNAALSILLSLGIISDDDTEIIFGSGFPLDQEYSQVCRTVNKVKTCMETGRSVVLLNIQNLYESLYDALNQCYVKLGGSYYVDLGLGAHRVKCKVKEGFRLIVIEEKNVVKCFQPNSEGRVLVLIQFYFENSKLSQRLLSCASHVLWIHLEDAVASAMAPVFAVVDGDNNLDHVTAKMSKLEQIEKCEELIKFPWLYNIKSTHSLFNTYAEDLVRMSMPECPYEVNQAFSVALVEFAKNLYKDWMQADPNDVSLLWLHVTYEGMRDNHQIFCKLLQQCGDMINTRDVREATEPAANRMIPLSITHEQDPEILKLLHLGRVLSPYLEWACHPFLG
ncbi:E3 ubiquitin-protein ligase rnf213-alpha-like [Colossoma macropomum]|uniref:E3 ubiquitin-protein ligase rnf213-alpha-like n=1 Tax=Colossoma macropomum TaxID=42526 RepID=UPI001863E5F8|nr:E3 ubiquitin-protein ligase rnf213-alpha-like [Colossoma macropomum]